MYRVVGCSDQQGAMIVSAVSLYDTYLGSLFVRLTLPLLFSSLGTTVVSRFFGTQDGNYRGAAIIYCIYIV